MGYISIWNGHEAPGTTPILGCGVYAIIFSKSSGAAGQGPAPTMDRRSVNEAGETVENQDLLDEIIFNFKANVLMKTFELKGPADRVTLYMTLYILQCLKRLVGVKQEQAKAVLLQLAIEKFVAPGDDAFPFTPLYSMQGTTAADIQLWRDYMKQLRLEVGTRLPKYVYAYPTAEGLGNVHWMVFNRYSFLEACLEK